MTNSKGAPPQLTWTNLIITLAVILTAGGGAWSLFQSQFSSIQREFAANVAAINSNIGELDKRIERNRESNIGRVEHTEFVKRMDQELAAINRQISIIESTRPTTGELSAVGTNNKEQLAEIKERIRSLEDNLRRPNSLAPVTQSPPGH